MNLKLLELETRCYSLRAQINALDDKIKKRGAIPRYLKCRERLLAKLETVAENWQLEKFISTFSVPFLDPIQVMGDTDSFAYGHL